MVYISSNNAIDKVSSSSASSFVTDVASILTNEALENIDLTLESSRVTDAANID